MFTALTVEFQLIEKQRSYLQMLAKKISWSFTMTSAAFRCREALALSTKLLQNLACLVAFGGDEDDRGSGRITAATGVLG
ncbi:hypothetical protein HJG54_32030 [Leptolyngbya sp. NK1-12]|uniref:Uncharacterized protein n=1 Tax=Leptolyngbya sp. NK1-12 TaxID=2547451 RepID=A0AA96WQW6_9CYAN|nr:hypothetical protein [Leptolyngbya sp. NK1-12]MBF2046885.1 hypothetical protein [Elainella sp. C42_A2020_010]RNJ68712.1 MAG: hypothetical protein EDM05_13635 [Leptolyngbya sp. IPPAS B-1204]WNZ27506.1 hypothetical protein HJG54_32030 [Leptolyngbya sp. NK1-12]